MIKAIVYHGSEAVKTYEFDKSSITIGRLPTNDIPINSVAVSRIHLRLHYSPEKKTYVATDLTSLNGTYLNGERITENNVTTGVRLIIGQHTIVPEFIGIPSAAEIEISNKVELNAGESTASEHAVLFDDINTENGMFFSSNEGSNDKKNIPAKKDEIIEDVPVKAFLFGVNNKLRFKINKRKMTFGSAHTDDFYVESNMFASDNMATLTINDNDEYIITSNLIMGKFKVNGNKVSRHHLKDKDKIEFGSSAFSFKIKDE